MTCRRVLDPVESCDHVDAEVLDLVVAGWRDVAKASERSLPILPRDRTHPIVYAALTFATLIWTVWVVMGIIGGAGLVFHLLVGLVSVAVAASGWRSARKNRRRRLAPGSEAAGTVANADTIEAAVTGVECAAFELDVALFGVDHDALVARFGRTGRIVVDTDDGRRVEIPDGPVRLVARKRVRSFTPEQKRAIDDEIVKRVDPNGADRRLRKYNRILTAYVSIGDRIAIESPLVVMAPSRSEIAGDPYRDPAQAILTTQGTPVLRALDQ